MPNKEVDQGVKPNLQSEQGKDLGVEINDQNTDTCGEEALGGALGSGDPVSSSGRVRTMTEKGLAYSCNQKLKALRALISKWRTVASHAEKTLTDSENILLIKQARTNLENSCADLQDCFQQLLPILSTEDENVYASKIEDIEEIQLDLMRKISSVISEIRSDSSSRSSRRSASHSQTVVTPYNANIQNVSLDKPAILEANNQTEHINNPTPNENASIHNMLTNKQSLNPCALDFTSVRTQVTRDSSSGNLPKSISSNKFAPIQSFTTPMTTIAPHKPHALNNTTDVNVHSSNSIYIPDTNHNRVYTANYSSQPLARVSSVYPALGNPFSFPGPLNDVVSESSASIGNPLLATSHVNLIGPTVSSTVGNSGNLVNTLSAPGHNSTSNSPALQGIDELVKAFTDQSSLGRIPAPEPGIFTGEPLKYPAWKAAFDILVDGRSIPNTEKLYYLRKYLGGNAAECVEACLALPCESSYQTARKILEKRYGDSYLIANAFRDKIESWKRIPARDGTALLKYADFLHQCSLIMENNQTLMVLNDERENHKMLTKLPDWVTTRWSRIVFDWRDSKGQFPPFRVFTDFLLKEARIATDPSASLQALSHEKRLSTTDTKERVHGRNLATGSEETKSSGSKWQKTCYNCNSPDHRLDKCPDFEVMTYEKRRDLVKSKGLCFGCLGKGHLSKECRNRKTCGKCQKRHPTVLHTNQRINEKGQHNQSGVETVRANNALCDTSTSYKASTVVPVLVSHERDPSNERLIYAMLDSQSDTSFILSDTANALNLHGSEVNLILSTMTSTEEPISTTKIQNLKVRALDSNENITIDTAYTRDIMPVNRQHIPTNETVASWPHLHHIRNLLKPLQDVEVGLLIGYDCPQALVPREVVPHPTNEGPYGMKTDLGWSVVGLVKPKEYSDDPIGVSHRTLVHEIVINTTIKEAKVKLPIKDPLTVMLEQEFVEGKGPLGVDAYSQDDVEFLRIVEKGIKVCKDGHYEMPLPLKECKIPPVNNRDTALTRLRPLKRRFERDIEYKEKYVSNMNDLLQNGYAEPARPVHGPVWYLPHHGVIHARKPGKLRLVFDASAKHLGYSLNDALLQGPDLTNKLVGVLCRFRLEQVAFSCDVKSMFHQFRVIDKDRDYLRFLWWENGDTSKSPRDYRMTVHLFGATSSPACANYGLKRIAEDYGGDFCPEASDFLRHDFYVDDGLKSVSTIEKAKQIMTHTKEMCSHAGLHLHKFLSPTTSVIADSPETDGKHSQLNQSHETKTQNLLDQQLSVERALGVVWNVENDSLGFKIQFQSQPLTRRGILSSISSIYDPLGFAAPVIMSGKKILQDICRQNKDWDEHLDDEIVVRWQCWLSDIVNLETIEIPRCYKPDIFGDCTPIELHHFADASSEGHGACSYLKYETENGQKHSALVYGKSRVSPLRAVSIPRLELTAAVTAAKISKMLKKELKLTNITEYFWTDSTAVLGYISNERKKQETFVANRIQAIRDISRPEQWSHVPTKENPADVASRGCSAGDLANNITWFRGPNFLLSDVAKYSQTIHQGPSPTVTVHRCVQEPVNSRSMSILDRLKHMSSWSKMINTIATCLLAAQVFRKKSKPRTLSPVDLLSAQQFIVRLVQEESFPDEIADLKGNQAVKLNSPIHKVDPFLDKDGLLRVGGRLENSELTYEEKHPMLLPRKHEVSHAVIRYVHHRAAHPGRQATVNEVRAAGFWILHASKTVGQLISGCYECRRKRGRVGEQKMADLPSDRVEVAPPFTNVGIDFFGPFTIKEGRKELKRWGCIFTCLSSRAVHLEVASSLSTDCFINVLRRFVAIRGNISRLRSDRGTNFVGANNELREAVKELDEDRIKVYLAQQRCDFVFNSPHASHMGGVWERPIRTARSVLSTLLKQEGGQLDDESLRTLMAETSAIINSRPLTVDSVNDPTNPLPLTANMLLTSKSSVIVPPPGNFMRADIYSRKRWRRVQHLANTFWTRWRKEYLQQLQSRHKWLRNQRDFKEGDIVLVKDDTLPRNEWKLARVRKVIPSHDNKIRKVLINIGSRTINKDGKRKDLLTELERPISQLVLLIESTNDTENASLN